MSVAIVAALPREVAGLVRGKKADKSLSERGIFLFRSGDAVVVAAGMGANRVALAVEAAFACTKVDKLVSVGLAGSCSASVLPGTILRAGSVIESRTGERFAAADSSEQAVLVSTEQIASVPEKRRLRESYGAAMVDMEAATVARLARAHNVAFEAVKGISEAHDMEIEALAKFSGPRGEFQTARFALYTALHPRSWRSAISLGKYSNVALQRLTETLLPLINTR